MVATDNMLTDEHSGRERRYGGGAPGRWGVSGCRGQELLAAEGPLADITNFRERWRWATRDVLPIFMAAGSRSRMGWVQTRLIRRSLKYDNLAKFEDWLLNIIK